MSNDVSGMRLASKDKKTVCEIKIEMESVIFSKASVFLDFIPSVLTVQKQSKK